MKKLLLYLQNHQTSIAGLVLFIVSIGVVVYLNPREIKFKYEFQKGKPWQYENLVAPFDFAVRKSEELLEEERKEIRENKTIFLSKNPSIAENQLVSFEREFENRWKQTVEEEEFVDDEKKENFEIKPTRQLRQEMLNQGRDLLGRAYSTGILQPIEEEDLSYDDVMLTEQGISTPIELSRFHSIQSASDEIKDALEEAGRFRHAFMLSLLMEHLEHNVFYNEELTQKYLESQLDNILPTRGMVQKGELIITEGNIIDEERYAKLNSLRQIFEGDRSGEYSLFFILLGQILQVTILLGVLYVFLIQFRPQLMEDISKLTFILLNVLFVVAMARVVTDLSLQYIYLVPFVILPITLRSFFDTRLALFVHMIAILLCGFLVTNSFEFIYLQFVAGVASVVLVNNLYKRSHLFFTAAKIILVYCFAYLSIAMVQEGSLDQIDPVIFAFFAGNGFLTLMSFPLIYFQEKVFGLVSDVSLLELSDTNNPLLRELAQKAPGTFQHSLQVANLAEAAILNIRGNALLVRTGALYHDIGKMANPMYFIENQSTGLNPHDELSFEESAEIIINHVKQGIKIAKKNNLPDILIDFIRTHHGTTTVMYFYRQYIKNFPEEEVDLAKFAYPGPKPFSKETAALMMADSVEAASRSLDRPDHDSIDKLVENIIDHQVENGQFENADITMKDVKDIKKIFKKMLMNIYHVRIQYPE